MSTCDNPDGPQMRLNGGAIRERVCVSRGRGGFSSYQSESQEHGNAEQFRFFVRMAVIAAQGSITRLSCVVAESGEA